MDEPLALLVEQYPAHRSELERRYRTEPDFQELCRDYALLQRMAERLQNAPVESAERMRRDYSAALAELEVELRLLLGIDPGAEAS